MNRAERRRAARETHPIVAAVRRVDAEQKRLEAELTEQAREIRRTSPTPNETPEEALAAVEAMLVDLSQPKYELVAKGALEELRGLRADLLARIGAG